MEYDGLTIVGGYEPEYIGFSAEKLFKSGKTYQEIAGDFAKQAYEKYGIALSASDIDIHYGESSNE